MTTSDEFAVVWSVVRGDSPTAQAVEPAMAGVEIPRDVLDWAEGHGLSDEDPDVYLLVAPADEAGEVSGEVAWIKRAASAEDLARIRAELAGRVGGVPLTDALVGRLSAEAEQGYDLAGLRPRGGIGE
ncbi:hypothetical protein E1091_00175 [Micromonospora fluostatini]|uniref:Uncharacterized protein n=1 Tax=Micromonospora fluostatini TaxID=1629071 RepID=A0ABY2DM86_9ACTN|nr:hypothetical protein E1091_00175 [Micromonospora fluostatini]